MARATTTEREPIFVKVARTGSTVQELCLNGSRTIAAALEAYGVTIEEDDDAHVRVNGAPVTDLEKDLSQGDIVTVAGKIAGGLGY